LGSGIIAERFVQRREYDISADELEQALDMTDKEEIRDEKEMLEGIIRFSDEMVKEIMTSRQDIVDIDIKSSFKDVIDNIVENNYSRIPVYQGSIDNIRGILYIKDLLPHIGKANSFRWQTLIRPAHFVPETKKIDDLLREFQTNKVHIAIVVDEFGGTSGIITLEDILEEIVGEISDEYDEEDNGYVKLDYKTYVFEGKTKIVDLCRILSLDDDYFEKFDEADTLAGLLLELKGDFPGIHEKFEFGNLIFEILKKEQRRIARVKVTIKG
jgi:gliding motility-associated protein GldE